MNDLVKMVIAFVIGSALVAGIGYFYGIFKETLTKELFVKNVLEDEKMMGELQKKLDGKFVDESVIPKVKKDLKAQLDIVKKLENFANNGLQKQKNDIKNYGKDIKDIKEQVDSLEKQIKDVADQTRDVGTQMKDVMVSLVDQMKNAEDQREYSGTKMNVQEAIKKSESPRLIDVKLSWSKRNKEKDLLVLNPEGSDIKEFLQDGCVYTLTAPNQKTLRLKSFFDEGMVGEHNEPTQENIGRIHYDQFDELFRDPELGVGIAKVQATPGCDK